MSSDEGTRWILAALLGLFLVALDWRVATFWCAGVLWGTGMEL